MFSLILLSQLIITSINANTGQSTGIVFHCPGNGLYAHPDDWHKYINCSYISSADGYKGWFADIQECPPLLVWDQNHLICINQDNNTRITPNPVDQHNSTKHVLKCFVCPKSGVFAYPASKNKFIICKPALDVDGHQVGWQLTLRQCHPGYQWNSMLERCLWDQVLTSTMATPSTTPAPPKWADIYCKTIGLNPFPANPRNYISCRVNPNNKKWYYEERTCGPDHFWVYQLQYCVKQFVKTQPVFTKIIDKHPVDCYGVQSVPHPTNSQKYLLCFQDISYNAWNMTVFECPPDYHWYQINSTCSLNLPDTTSPMPYTLINNFN